MSKRSLYRTLSVAGATILCGALFLGCGRKAKGVLKAEDQFARAHKYYNEQNYLRSAEEFQKVIYNYPGIDFVDSAQYMLAKSYMNDEEYELAAVEFERLMKNYPRSGHSQEALYRIGYCYYRAAPENYGLDQTEVKRAIGLIEDFLVDFPDSDYAPEARKTLQEAYYRLAKKTYKSAELYTRINAWESARIYFQLVIDEYTSTEFAPLAQLGKGKALLKLKRYDEAAQTLNSFIAVYPEHKKIPKARDLLSEANKHVNTQTDTSQTAQRDSNDSTDNSPR